jgi:sulfate permease, SulP family
LTVLFNITVAVEIGMLLAAFLLIKRLTEAASVQTIRDLAKDADAPSLLLPEGVTALRFRGALFFGVAEKVELALRVPADAQVVVLDMLEVIYIDTNVADLLHRFAQRELAQGREVIIFGLSRQAESLFERTGLTADLGRDRVVETRRQALELARLRSRHYAQNELFS